MARDSAIVRRLIFWALVAGGIVFAVQGGEYSSLDLLRQQREIRATSKAIDSMQRVVDSLQRYEHLVETDPATQERIAREEFGMVRDNELLYRFAEPPDTSRKR